MFNDGNQIHNFMSSFGSGTVIISGSVFQLFHPRLHSKFLKSDNIDLKMQYGMKNAEFDADFESIAKVEKNACEKIFQRQRKSDRKMSF